jgi:hypothetical protein
MIGPGKGVWHLMILSISYTPNELISGKDSPHQLEYKPSHYYFPMLKCNPQIVGSLKQK